MILNWKEDGSLKSKITADYNTHKVSVENYTDDILDRAFGVKENPTWEDFEDFLSDRCISRDHSNLRLYLDQIGVDSYDELDIIYKTQGRMAEDHFSLEIEEEKM